MEELQKDQNPEMENSENKEIKKSKSLDKLKTEIIEGDEIIGGASSKVFVDTNYGIYDGLSTNAGTGIG